MPPPTPAAYPYRAHFSNNLLRAFPYALLWLAEKRRGVAAFAEGIAICRVLVVTHLATFPQLPEKAYRRQNVKHLLSGSQTPHIALPGRVQGEVGMF